MQFSELKLTKPLRKALKDMDFTHATPIQAQAIPPSLEGKDILGSAQTGTGKTVAFLVPAIDRLIRNQKKLKHPRVVVLTPTRELALQVTEEAQRLAAHTHLRILPVYGGSRMSQQIRQLRQGVHIVVATPGRLLDHMRRRNINFKDLQTLVLDEADRMFDMGFMPDIKKIILQTPRRRQTMLFSATMPPAIVNLTRNFQNHPVKIELDIDTPPEKIDHAVYPVPKHLKTSLLIALLNQKGVDSALIFTATKQEADIVTRKLQEDKFEVACLHGDFRQRKRLSALKGFRSGRYKVLVATNIAARGLDVEGITHVINYDTPEQPENYIHRVGRTARVNTEGDAITLMTPEDVPLVERIERSLGYKIKRKELPGFDYDVPTPSWAKPSADAILHEAQKSRTLADRFRSMNISSRW